MVTTENHSGPVTRSQSKKVKEVPASSCKRYIIAPKAPKKKKNAASHAKAAGLASPVTSSSASNSEASISNNPFYDHLEAIFLKEEFLVTTQSNIMSSAPSSSSHKSFANILVTGEENKSPEEIVAELQQKLLEKEVEISAMKQNSNDQSSAMSPRSIDMGSLKEIILRMVKEVTNSLG